MIIRDKKQIKNVKIILNTRDELKGKKELVCMHIPETTNAFFKYINDRASAPELIKHKDLVKRDLALLDYIDNNVRFPKNYCSYSNGCDVNIGDLVTYKPEVAKKSFDALYTVLKIENNNNVILESITTLRETKVATDTLTFICRNDGVIGENTVELDDRVTILSGNDEYFIKTIHKSFVGVVTASAVNNKTIHFISKKAIKFISATNSGIKLNKPYVFKYNDTVMVDVDVIDASTDKDKCIDNYICRVLRVEDDIMYVDVLSTHKTIKVNVADYKLLSLGNSDEDYLSLEDIEILLLETAKMDVEEKINSAKLKKYKVNKDKLMVKYKEAEQVVKEIQDKLVMAKYKLSAVEKKLNIAENYIESCTVTEKDRFKNDSRYTIDRKYR